MQLVQVHKNKAHNEKQEQEVYSTQHEMFLKF